MGSPYHSRRIGRAASPPTWACYEQIPYHDDYSDTSSDSCSEDDDDYAGAIPEDRYSSDTEDRDHTSADRDDELNMDMDEEGNVCSKNTSEKDVKGKQRAIDRDSGKPRKDRHRRKHRQPGGTLRPILTIQKSQGFVWNQVSTVFVQWELIVDPRCQGTFCASVHQRSMFVTSSTCVSRLLQYTNRHTVTCWPASCPVTV